MLRTIILAAAVASALALYFSIALVFPQLYLSMELKRPEPVVTNVSLSVAEIEVWQTLVISVTGMNRGEEADMQIVSLGFPNLTATDSIKVIEHDFAQTPFLITAGDQVGSEYTGEKPVAAQYPSVEAYSRPWQAGSIYSIDVQVTPEADGRFVIFVKSVAFPHSWDGAHWPQDGVTDFQKEFVHVQYVQVTKP